MEKILIDIFGQFGNKVTVENIDNNPELFRVSSNIYGTITICVKELTFGGRENLSYEQRVQIKGYSNNYAFNKISQNEKSVLLGIASNSEGEVVICAWKLKYSTASNTLSKQIKDETIRKALLEGFAQQLKGRGEFACAFRKEFLYFYLKNSDWIHDAPVDDLNNHIIREVEENYEIDQEERVIGGTNILLYGVPGSGKSHTIETEYCNDENYMERIVFHPDYTYSDFVGQILPNVSNGIVSYIFTAGPFTSILKKAYENPSKEYYLVIEEINRGNAPAIFGEVFQLLDRDENGTSEYGISNENIAKIVYGNENNKVRIPSNMFIIGTMNTSDQNVFTLDTAFQRRWDMRMIENSFENVDNTFANKTILDTTVTWKIFCTAINNIILEKNVRMTSSEDKRLGTYFIHLKDLVYDDNADKVEVDESTRLKAKRNNSRFCEKVLKYLWDDAFKFSREDIFKVEQYNSLEAVIKKFMKEKKNDRFTVFKENVYDAIVTSNVDEQGR